MGSLINKKGSSAGKGGARTGGGGGFKFAYRPRTPEQVRERASRSIGGRDSFFSSEVQFFTPRAGENNVRILPPPPDKSEEWGHYGVTLFAHYGIGADQSAYLCLDKQSEYLRDKLKGEGNCPICEARAAASAQGEEELAKELAPRERVAVYVIDRAQESKGPLLWNVPAGTEKDIAKLLQDPTTGEVLTVDSPEDGYDLIFTREGEGKKTKYKGIQFARRSSPLCDDIAKADEWLKHICDHPIDQCLQFHGSEHIAKVFEGQAPSKTEEGETRRSTERDERPARSSGRAASSESESSSRPRIQTRKPAAEPEQSAGESDLPTWEQLQDLDEEGLAQLGEESKVEFPEDGFDSVDALRSFVAEALGIEEPKEEKEEKEEKAEAAKPAGSWRDRLNGLKNKSKK